MTVSSTTLARIQYNGDGSTLTFPTSFVFSNAADLQVYSTVIATGVDTLLTINVDYTVTGGGGTSSPASGSVVFGTAPTSSVRITILRSVANTQNTSYVENDAFPAKSHEAALDKLTLEVQDLKASLARAIIFSAGSTSANIQVSSPVPTWLTAWSSDGTTLDSVDPTIVAAPVSLSSTGLMSCTALTPRTYAGRTLTASGAGITIVNGDGVSDNPTISLSTDLSAIASLSSTGLLVRTGSGTWTQRTITGTSNQITVTNGDGVSGTPTLSLPSAITTPGSLTTTTTLSSGGNFSVLAGNQSQWYNTGGTYYVGFKAGTLSASKVWTLPTADGTSGQVMSTDGSGNLSWSSASAPITVTGTSNQITVTGGSGTAPTVSLPSAITTPGSLTTTTTLSSGTTLSVNSASDLRLYNSENTFYTGFKAPTLSANKIYALPTGDGTSGQLLSTNGSGNLSWVSSASGGALVYISTTTVSGSPSTIDITSLSGSYSKFLFIFEQLTITTSITATNQTTYLSLQLYQAGTLNTSSQYTYVANKEYASALSGVQANLVSPATSYVIGAYGSQSGTSGDTGVYSFGGELWLSNLTDLAVTGSYKQYGTIEYSGTSTGKGAGTATTLFGYRAFGNLTTTGSAINGIRLLITGTQAGSTKNFVNGGKIYVYGIV